MACMHEARHVSTPEWHHPGSGLNKLEHPHYDNAGPPPLPPNDPMSANSLHGGHTYTEAQHQCCSNRAIQEECDSCLHIESRHNHPLQSSLRAIFRWPKPLPTMLKLAQCCGQGRGQGRAGQGRAGQGRAGQGRVGHTWEELPDDLVPGALDQVTTMQQPAGPNVI